MKNIVGVVNYGIAGNIHSIEKAIKKAGGQTLVINTGKQFDQIDKVILPGVGSFKDAMQGLKKYGLIEDLYRNKKPILGICLGMQLLSTLGFEYGQIKGLGFIQAEVRPILVNAKIPHVGFNKVEIVGTNDILEGLDNKEFYFMHSFEVVNSSDITSYTQYADHKFVSSIQKGNIYGVQFHPEKSRAAGIQVLRNFINLEKE